MLESLDSYLHFKMNKMLYSKGLSLFYICQQLKLINKGLSEKGTFADSFDSISINKSIYYRFTIYINNWI